MQIAPIYNIATALGLRPFYRLITNPVKKQLGAKAIYYYRAKAIYLEMYREVLFKPRKRVYISKCYPNPIPVFTLPIHYLVVDTGLRRGCRPITNPVKIGPRVESEFRFWAVSRF
jgi:hypothetical protein